MYSATNNYKNIARAFLYEETPHILKIQRGKIQIWMIPFGDIQLAVIFTAMSNVISLLDLNLTVGNSLFSSCSV